MILWGTLWFGILGILFLLLNDGWPASIIFIACLITGALAGKHLQSIMREMLKAMQHSKQRQSSAIIQENSNINVASKIDSSREKYLDDEWTFDPPKSEVIKSPSVSKLSHNDLWLTDDEPLLNTDKVTLKNEVISPPSDTEISWENQPSSKINTQTTTQPLNTPLHDPPIDRLFNGIKNWFLSGNTVVRVGIIVLFIGLAFLAKYTAQLGLFPIQARLSIVALFGMGLLAFGFIKRNRMAQYALHLQGAGVAVLYLTLLAAMRGYGLLPMPITFALMIVVCALGCALAYLQNGRVLAFVSFAGGFAAPLLLSTGSNNYVGLFSYYTILNIAILWFALVKTWRSLNLLGFLATFGVATFWGVLKYKPENYLSAQLFLFIFFAVYLLTAILYARNTARADTLNNVPIIDSTLIFGTPLVAFCLQFGLVHSFAYGAAFSAIAMATVYIAGAYILVNQTRGYNAILLECFLALGVGFITLSIPLALNGEWIGVAWALEGLGAFWVGMRQARWMPRALGLVLQCFAWGVLLDHSSFSTVTPFLNTAFLNYMLMAVCALTLAYWLRQPLNHSNSSWAVDYVNLERHLGTPFYLYGFVVVFVSVCVQWIHASALLWFDYNHSLTLLVAMTFIILSVISSFWGSGINRAAQWPSFLFAPVLFFTLLILVAANKPLLSGWGLLFWPIALLLYFLQLYRAEKGQWVTQEWLHPNHAIIVWLKALLIGQSLFWLVQHSSFANSAWASVIFLVSLTLFLVLLTLWAARSSKVFPLATQQSAYLFTAALPIAGLIILNALWVALSSSGETQPLPYIPLLNPTDLSIALGVVAVAFWGLKLKQTNSHIAITEQITYVKLVPILAGFTFIFINTVWLRFAHHFFSIPWNASALFNSYVVQTGYAILWTLLALFTMVWAHKHRTRGEWMCGAGLLALTVVKLIFVDLANTGGFERIIAFIVVGMMMLIIGYLAPLPPSISAPSDDK